MNDFHPHLIETEETTIETKNRFPILAQLAILSVLLMGFFGALLTKNYSNQNLETVKDIDQIITDEREYLLMPQEITEEVPLVAQSAFVWDVKNQKIIYQKNSEVALPLASITKLMTSLLAHELLSEKKNIKVPLSAIMQEGDSGLAIGEEITIEKLRELALISSSNDAAFALAASVGALLGERDPVAQFVTGMNIRAEELNLKTLEFKNTTGLDLSETTPGAVGSARDVSLLMEYIVTKYPEIIAPTQLASARIYNTAGAYHEVNNTNEIALNIPNMIGSKTGYTEIAGGNLTVAFDAGLNRPIIITVLGSTRDERFEDVMNLVEATQEIFANQN